MFFWGGLNDTPAVVLKMGGGALPLLAPLPKLMNDDDDDDDVMMI